MCIDHRHGNLTWARKVSSKGAYSQLFGSASYSIAICSHFCIVNDKHVHVWVELVMVFVLYEYCYNIFIFFFTDSYVCLRFGFSCGLTTGLLTWSPGMLMVKDLTGTRLDLSPEVLCLRLLNPTSESSARRGKIALIM